MEQQAKFAFDKQTSNMLKGVFLILMFCLHFFCFPSWYVESVTLPQTAFMENMQGHFQICVAGFAFLTGFFYNYTKEKTFKYTFRKWIDFLIPYWFILILFLIIGLVTKTYSFTFSGFALEVLALRRSIMNFCWYVPFYIISMLALFILTKLFKNKTLLILIFGVAAPIIVYYGAGYIGLLSNGILNEILEKFQVFFPISAAGYAVSNWKLFEKADKLKINNYIRAIIGVVLVVIVFFEPTWLYYFDKGFVFKVAIKLIRIASIPFFVYGLIQMFNVFANWIKKPFEVIGKYSLLMWFVHCIFFNCSAKIFQPTLYFSGIPIVILLEGILICLAVSFVMNYPVNFIKKIAFNR